MKLNSTTRAWMKGIAARAALMVCAITLAFPAAPAQSIDWVTVGDPGNAGQTLSYGGTNMTLGAVADSFRIMKYEFTNQQYTAFLNSVAATDTYSLYKASMGSDARGGITQSGSAGSFTYAVKPNMGDKPVNFVSWFDAARVSNWLMNGATSTSSTETGAYTLVGGQTSGNAPAVNSGATFFIPTEDQWYKAAYYKGSGTNAGYWEYATQVTGTAPTAVSATTVGTGTSGGVSPVISRNFANYNRASDWNSQDGNVTTVGTNGGPSAYGPGHWRSVAGGPTLTGGVRPGQERPGGRTQARRMCRDPAKNLDVERSSKKARQILGARPVFGIDRFSLPTDPLLQAPTRRAVLRLLAAI